MFPMRSVVLASIILVTDAAFDRVSLAEVDPAAVCTDGSPAGYYISHYFTPTNHSAWEPETTWLVYLEGGGWCYDAESCKSRCGTPDNPSKNSVCSSTAWPDKEYLGGIFFPSSEQSVTHAANKIFVKYCTSDGHMGNAEAFGWQFRGATVVRAVLHDLVVRHGLGSGAKQHRLIFGGGSAGARGAMVHLDYVAQMLGDVASNIDIVGFLDSPLYIDIKPPFHSSFPGFQYITQSVHGFANVTHLGKECMTKHADEQWKCMFGEYRLPLVQTPYFLVASQYDAFQLGNLVGHKPSSIYDEFYADRFASKTRDALKTIRTALPLSDVYSWACYNHMTSPTPAGFNTDTTEPKATTMEGAFEQYLGLAPLAPTSMEWIDTCRHFNCGSGCGNSNDADSSMVV